MKEDLIDEEVQPLEKLNVEMPINSKNNKFKKNKCPVKLKANGYIKFGNKDERDKFISSGISPIFPLKYLDIAVCFLYSFTFYTLLITYIVSKETILLVFLILVYIISILMQTIAVPKMEKMKSRAEFDNDINKILNSKVTFKLENKKLKKSAMYQSKYTMDISGIINIPSTYNFARIKDVQLYTKKDLKTLTNDFNTIYKSCKVDYKIYYDDEELKPKTKDTYYLSNGDAYSIEIYDTIFCLLVLQWIRALSLNFLASKKCIDISIAKLITDKYSLSTTKFSVHGKDYDIRPCTTADVESNEELDRELEKLKKRKEKQEEEKRERKKNTHVLSRFKNGNNFTIVVKRIYNDVYIRFEAKTPGRTHWYKGYIGSYDPSIKERIENEKKATYYYPEGVDFRIEVLRGVYSYTVTLGDEYTENFDYNS